MPNDTSGTSDQQNTSKLIALLDAAVDAIITIDSGGRIQSANPATFRLFGFDNEDLIGRDVADLMAEPHRSSHGRYISNYLTSGKKRIIGIGREVEGARKDGSVFPMHLSVSEFSHNGERYFTGIIHDISKRKQAETMLAESERRLGLVLDASADGWWDRDLTTGEELWSEGLYRLFGHAPDDFVSGRVCRIEMIHPDDREMRQAAEDAHLLSDTPYKVDYRARNRQGDYLWLRCSGKAIRDAAGRPIRMIGTLTDITELMHREEQYQRAARLETLGQLTGGIAHDFNNILTVITGNLELLEMQTEDAAQRDLLKEALNASEMGAKLTDRLLTFARRRRLEPRNVDLNDILLGMTSMIRRTIGEQIDISTIVASGLWSTRVDPSQVENAILNLAINARDAMPDGGRLIIETRNIEIDEDEADEKVGLEPGRFVALTITDTGTGMPPEIRERAFEPFFSTKPHGQGTGLGLSMVYGFARQSNGCATIYSEPGVGSTINIYLPAFFADIGAAPGQESGAETIVFGRGELILVVEDAPQLRELTCKRLEELGYAVVSADTAQGALDVLESEPGIDLVFTDIVMPGGMTGYQLAEKLRTERPSLPVLLTSGYAEELVNSELLASRQLKLLRKPYRQTELARAIATELRRQGS